MKLTRRQILKFGMASAAVLAIPVFADRQITMSGRILGLSTLDPADGHTELSSLVSLDLQTGEVTYHDLGVHRFGHSLLRLPGGGYYATPYGDDDTGALFLDEDFSVTGEIKAPAGHGYGGHSVLLPDNKRIFGHFNQAAYEGRHAVADMGQIYTVDIETQRLETTTGSEILHGHDMLVTNDGKHIVVGDDGTVETRFGDAVLNDSNPFSLIPGEPRLVIYDAQTLRQMRSIPLDINGAVVHLAQDSEGFLYGAVEQFIANNAAGRKTLREMLGSDAGLYFGLLKEDLDKMGPVLPYPGPLLRINLETGQVGKQVAALNQMPFDVKVNAATGRVFHVFTQSNVIAMFDPLRNRWVHFSTEPYGIEMPYGLVDVPGTTLMAVNGFHHGIAVFETGNLALVRKFETGNFGIKHLRYEPLGS